MKKKHKLTLQQRNAAARAYKRGVKVSVIADEYDVTPGNVIKLARARLIPIRRLQLSPYGHWLHRLARYYGAPISPIR